MDERKIAEKLNRRSRPALEAAVRQLTPYVSTVIFRTLAGRACREDVEELAADVFMSLWNHAGEIDPRQGLRPWLSVVARNRAIDWQRTHHSCEPLPEDAADPSEGPEQRAVRRDWSARLWAAVDGLPEPDRSLFFRYYYEEEPLKEIAKTLGLSQSAAKQKLFRGRKRLKTILSEGGETV